MDGDGWIGGPVYIYYMYRIHISSIVSFINIFFPSCRSQANGRTGPGEVGVPGPPPPPDNCMGGNTFSI